MRYQVLFPGNNKIGMISVNKLDPDDNYLSGPEGMVMCSLQNEEQSSPGIFLKSCQFNASIMSLLMSSTENLSMQLLCTEEDNVDYLGITIKIEPRVAKSKADTFVKVGFKATRESFEKFIQLAEEYNKFYLTFKTSSYLFFFHFNHESGEIVSREVELYN